MLRKVSLQKVLFSTHQNCMNGRSFILFKIFRLLGRNFHQNYFLQGQVRGASSLLFSDGPRGSARPDRLLRAASDTRPASLDRRNLWRTFSTGEFLPFRQLRGKKNIFVSFRNPTWWRSLDKWPCRFPENEASIQLFTLHLHQIFVPISSDLSSHRYLIFVVPLPRLPIKYNQFPSCYGAIG